MLNAIKEFFGIYPKPVKQEQVEQPVVLVKEEPKEPAAVKCGCGRSSSGFCMGLHKMTDEEWAVSDKNPNKVVAAKDDVKPIEKPKTTKKTAAKPAKASTPKATVKAAPKKKNAKQQ